MLEPLGIEVKLDLPGVGTNVQEHVTMGFNRLSKLTLLPPMQSTVDSKSLEIRDDQNIITSGMLEDPAHAEELRKSL